MARSPVAHRICIAVLILFSPWYVTCLQPKEAAPNHGWKEDDQLILDDETRDALEYASMLYKAPATRGNYGKSGTSTHGGHISAQQHKAASNLHEVERQKVVEMSSTHGSLVTNDYEVAGIAPHCMRRNKPLREPKLCRSVGYGEHEIKQAKLRPTKCLQEMLPGVKAKICTLCDGRNCDKMKKVLEKFENHLDGNALGVISLLRSVHTLQERLHNKYKVWDDAFESATTPKYKHRLACKQEIKEGTFGPGLCRTEIEELMPGQSELVLNIADQNHNRMVTSGELRNFFSTALVFTHMAAPVVMHGSSLDAMQKFPFMERLQKWLGWEDVESPPLVEDKGDLLEDI